MTIVAAIVAMEPIHCDSLPAALSSLLTRTGPSVGFQVGRRGGVVGAVTVGSPVLTTPRGGDGLLDWAMVGLKEAVMVGDTVGSPGVTVGFGVGLMVGLLDGDSDGSGVGLFVGGGVGVFVPSLGAFVVGPGVVGAFVVGIMVGGGTGAFVVGPGVVGAFVVGIMVGDGTGAVGAVGQAKQKGP